MANLENQNEEMLRQERIRNTVLAKVEKHQALSDDDIRVVCPVAFKETMSSKEIRNLGLSKHYSFVPTSNVINDLRSMGWECVDAKQVKARKKSTRGYQKHMLTFEHPDYKITKMLIKYFQ